MESNFCNCGKPRHAENQRYCKECHNENARKNRPKYKELTLEEKVKADARSILHLYIKRGKIIKGCCLQCGSINKVEGHHEDYSKPLDVVWLCFKCHRKLHKLSIS